MSVWSEEWGTRLGRELEGALLEGPSHQAEELPRWTADYLSHAGKGLRPRLAAAACASLGIEDGAMWPWALALELFHNGTLVHDDLQDGDEERRGRPTFWKQHGMAQAINAGDLLYFLPFRLIAEGPYDDALSRSLSLVLARATAEVVRGQGIDVSLGRDASLDWEVYLELVRLKTAALFRSAIHGPLLMAASADPRRWNEGTRRELLDAAESLGVAFQLMDDYLDLFGDKGRGEVGRDIQEGKIGALWLRHWEKAPEDRVWQAEYLQRSERVQPDEIARFADALRESGAATEVRAMAAERIDRALATLHGAEVLDQEAVTTLRSKLLGS